jgi:hypothetical protein
MFNGVFDRWEGADDTLVIGDFGVGLFVERDVEVDLSVRSKSGLIAIGTILFPFSIFTYPDEDAFVF